MYKLKVEYDAMRKSAYIVLLDEIAEELKNIGEHVWVDFAQDGKRIVGIEITGLHSAPTIERI